MRERIRAILGESGRHAIAYSKKLLLIEIVMAGLSKQSEL